MVLPPDFENLLVSARAYIKVYTNIIQEHLYSIKYRSLNLDRTNLIWSSV